MRAVIVTDKITDIDADEENANYPADNVTDDHPKKLWKATSYDAKLTLTVDPSSNAIAIFETNAYRVTITVKDGDGETVETKTYNLNGLKNYWEMTIGVTERTWTSVWHEYEYQFTEHTIEVDFETREAEIVECGVVRAGLARTFGASPQYGLKENLIDYSIEEKYNNGADYYVKGEIVRKFTGSLIVDRDKYFYQLFLGIAQQVGKQPLAWCITDVADHYLRALYAKLDPLPDGTHTHYNQSTININLLEVV